MSFRAASVIVLCASSLFADRLDLSKAVVVVRPGAMASAERTAATVLVEELEKRTGIRLNVATSRPEGQPAILISSRSGAGEGYRLSASADGPVVSIDGESARGALFGVGDLLRRTEWSRGSIGLPGPFDIATAPAYPIRGHQLGYRATANSYDAWDVAQYERYIRELALFGVNSIESIPFQDTRPSPVMKVSREEMNLAMGDICDRYGLDYWVWLPADFDLKDVDRRAALLDRAGQFFRSAKALAGVFFPGGDPGSNPPELVLPFLEDLSKRLIAAHPAARVWLSLQQFDNQQVDYVFDYIERRSPAWLAGLVAGPSSPPLRATRDRLPKRYKVRLYPDLTHNKLSQFEVPQWDQAYALTLGREAINPRAVEFARIFQSHAPLSDGFISYSDGAHDDINKIVWSALGWNPDRPVREILIDYARLHFGAGVAETAADAILALERNWSGPLVHNGSVEGTLLQWKQLEAAAPHLEAVEWRWQMLLMRAYYDADVRRRLISDAALEREANAALADAGRRGADSAIAGATAILNRPVERPLRARILELADRLFRSIGLQSSTEKYHASGAERGAVLDFVDLPLNNRWWLEDEFRKVRTLASETAKVDRLHLIATWENPGPGSYYDDLGHVGRSPREMRRDVEPSPDEPDPPGTTYWWWDQGKSRARLSWQITRWPGPMVYERIDSNAKYRVRSTGYGRALLRINGQPVAPVVDGQEMGEFKEFDVPPDAVSRGRLVLEWGAPGGEDQLNWRRRSRLAEVWLLKKER